ncbi:mitochondrial carrier protein MTM1 [Physcomitrium patens]|uniref:Mitochondrial carrier protein n=1 Tax=Physcomitrium patens TaxID=3218 RepID=A0A2K1K8D8_PHYPA|nr:mitochondrial carrier protein MTM1-like [Physcomitrium patens]XP_024382472.1 mitochondrial carrier protein MTM1-like [Physcomitrium patens]XP_024382473.1 mitochondrial carrier protein MTM1-like [Physcomitrium patens]XP_024382474.1 mitochondrial carrier protein MTM1-like [Physcomitrium patens]PNR50039.1 hypothetical protein PHYPA_011936 [Physcomitrium patens]|eukprot:XP_024382471.1 mitochondrial carrier protein MTM1-like [Physcomitrella patens]
MNEAMVPPTDPFRLRGLAIALDSSHVSDTQDGFYPSGLFAGMRSVLGSQEGRAAMKNAPLRNIDVREKAISAAGAAVISAVIVNPLDVAKTRLQAQGAGVSYQQTACEMEGSKSFKVSVDGRCPPACPRTTVAGVSYNCPPPGQQYKGTLDVMRRVAREEGFIRLWRGLNASLAIAVPSVGIYLPSYDLLQDTMCRYSDENSLGLKPYAPMLAGALARSLAVLVCSPLELAKTRMQAQVDPRTGKLPGIVSVLRSVNNTYATDGGRLQGIRVMWTGVGAQLARDVPFSAICWSVLEPVRGFALETAGPDPHIGRVLGANFAAGMLAGGIAAAATCPLDVVKTWRQIEKDPAKAMSSTLRQTLSEVWHKGGMRGLFAGVGPRIGRAAPSTGIVVSFYEVVKYVLHRT